LRKGIDVLIETIKKSNNKFNFYIAGNGPMQKKIDEIALLRRVKYQGYLNKEALGKVYTECDILFVPSRAESFSLAWLEAMSYGLPVISSPETAIGLPSIIQKYKYGGKAEGYLAIFERYLEKKINKRTG